MRPAALKALRMLRAAGDAGVTTHDFILGEVGSRFGARLHELRHEHGCVIEEKRQRPGASRYWLRHEPGQLDRAASGSAAGPPSPARSSAGVFLSPAADPGADGVAHASGRTVAANDEFGSGARLFDPTAEPQSAAMHDYEEAA